MRVLLVDDHALVRNGLRAVLDTTADCTVVGEAATGEAAVDLAETLQPDVVVMDLSMPGAGGVAATAALRERVPTARVLVLTTFADDARVRAALAAGATGYLLKDADPDDVVRAVQATARDEVPIDPRVARSLLPRGADRHADAGGRADADGHTGPDGHPGAGGHAGAGGGSGVPAGTGDAARSLGGSPVRGGADGPVRGRADGPVRGRADGPDRHDAGGPLRGAADRDAPDLPPRERDVLVRLARGLSNRQIATELGIAERTVKVHVGSVFRRIGVADRTSAALWARDHGW
ncbi:response regulator transcription factor [Curtobacterium sp. MCBD17_008]|uniref:response regulator n=1 Tax=Curtobacterium sp. MCBD17_008 TaxID=2175656 RepID=UPI0015E8BFB4|nr:response regulator transcription factor [Curtobacterium sp. MCBD17_008]